MYYNIIWNRVGNIGEKERDFEDWEGREGQYWGEMNMDKC